MLRKMLCNEQGSTLLMTVVVMMLLVVLSTVLITLSAAHFKISHTYNKNSDVYYKLNQQSETILKEIDSELEFAEKAAQAYITNELYTINNLDSTMLDQSYEGRTFNMSDLERILFDYELPQQDDSVNNYQTYFYDKYIQDVLNQADLLKDEFTSSETDSDKAYYDLLESYTEEIFSDIYFMVAREQLDHLLSDDSKELKGYYTMSFDSNRGVGTDSRTCYEPELIIEGKNQGDKESLKLRLQVVFPHYEAAPEVAYKHFKTNPVWTNAITASGHIDFHEGETRINGDLYAIGDASNDGIIVASVSNTQVNGNIYTCDDIVVKGNNSQLNVATYNTIVCDYKKNLYAESSDVDSAFYLEGINNESVTSTFGDSGEYSIGQMEDKLFWYFNKDELGGNVYCNNLKVDITAQSGNLEVNNAWVYNDVIMNGAKDIHGDGSNLTINNILLGLNSEGDRIVGNLGIDPRKSSTVVNNSFNKGGQITLNKYLISGLAYMPFDKKNGIEGNYYYRTVEGITSNNTEIFTEVYDTGLVNNDRYTLVTPQGDYDYYLEDYFSNSGIVIEDLFNVLDYNADSKMDVKTNIFINEDQPDDVIGYSKGAVLAHYYMNGTYAQYKKGGITQLNDNFLILPMKDYYSQKTEHFGLMNSTINSIDDCVVEAIIDGVNSDYYIYKSTEAMIDLAPNKIADGKFIYIDGPATITLSGQARGMIYSKGHLTITGSGSFNGSIICNGNVTLKPLATGALELNYDEQVIAKLINQSSNVEDFFNGYTHGQPNTYKYKTATTGYFTDEKRYKIESWKWEE